MLPDMQEKIDEIKGLLRTDIVSARKKAFLLLYTVEVEGTDNDRATAYHLIGLVAHYENKAKEAIDWYAKELKLREKLQDLKGASDVLNNLGAIYYSNGKLEKAKGYFEKSLKHRLAIDDKGGVAAVYNNLAGLLLKSGSAAEAFAMHSKALEINRELGDKERIGTSLQNIALIYFSQGDYDLALSNSLEALEISRANNDKMKSVQHMVNIGATLVKQKKNEEAKKYYRQCYDLSLTINYHLGLILSLQSLALMEKTQGHYREAIKYDEDCIRIAKTTEHLAEITESLSSLGVCYSHLKDYNQALKYLNDALALAKKTGIKESRSEAYLHLSDVYEKLKDHKKAFEYYKKHITLRDELVNKETTKTISEIRMRNAVEQKEKEARLLKEKSDAISMYARKLELSNSALNQFAHVASHDLREPLRMVSAYMGLLQRSMGDNITADQKMFINFAADGAKRMDTLIQDLLRLAKVDANPKITEVPLNTLIDEVKTNLQLLLHEKNAQIIAPALPVIMADRTQIMQLLQNIIGNGIKYNESPNPTITIGYQTTASTATLSIADNGIGIPAEYRERAFQIFQRVPTAKQYQGSGIGLAICKKIVDSLDGSITITDNPNGGTVFVITIPATLVVVK